MALPVFVGVGAHSNTTTVPYAGGGSAGDALIVVWESDTSGDVAAISGFTNPGSLGTSGGGHVIGCLVGYAAGSGSGNLTVSGVTTGVYVDSVCFRYSGVNATNVFDVFTIHSSLGSSTPSTGSIMSSVAGMEFVALNDDWGIGSASAPAGWTRTKDGNGANWWGGEKGQGAAGATGTQAFNTNGYGGGTSQAIVHGVIKPAGGATTPVGKVWAFPKALTRASRW